MILPGLYGIGGLIGGTEEPDSVTLVHTSASASETANYGDDTPGRWIVVLALGGNSVSAYNLAASISGVAGTIIKRHSTGNGSGSSTGTGIFVGQPSGSSGTVSITGTTAIRRFYVLRVIGYDLGTAVFTDDSTGTGIPPWSVNVPSNGLTLSVTQSANFLGSHTWSGLTERIADAERIPNKTASAAWDLNMTADAAKAIDVTASDTDGQTSAVIATFNHN